jgi:hypothetical protein
LRRGAEGAEELTRLGGVSLEVLGEVGDAIANVINALCYVFSELGFGEFDQGLDAVGSPTGVLQRLLAIR